MKSVLINFSGHTLNQEVVYALERHYDKIANSNPVEINFNETVADQIESLIQSLPVKIDGSYSLTINPPGQSTFAILLISYLHGLIGHFPNICYLERNIEGIYAPKTEYQIQPQNIRAAGRKFRYIQHSPT